MSVPVPPLMSLGPRVHDALTRGGPQFDECIHEEIEQLAYEEWLRTGHDECSNWREAERQLGSRLIRSGAFQWLRQELEVRERLLRDRGERVRQLREVLEDQRMQLVARDSRVGALEGEVNRLSAALKEAAQRGSDAGARPGCAAASSSQSPARRVPPFPHQEAGGTGAAPRGGGGPERLEALVEAQRRRILELTGLLEARREERAARLVRGTLRGRDEALRRAALAEDRACEGYAADDAEGGAEGGALGSGAAGGGAAGLAARAGAGAGAAELLAAAGDAAAAAVERCTARLGAPARLGAGAGVVRRELEAAAPGIQLGLPVPTLTAPALTRRPAAAKRLPLPGRQGSRRQPFPAWKARPPAAAGRSRPELSPIAEVVVSPSPHSQEPPAPPTAPPPGAARGPAEPSGGRRRAADEPAEPAHAVSGTELEDCQAQLAERRRRLLEACEAASAWGQQLEQELRRHGATAEVEAEPLSARRLGTAEGLRAGSGRLAEWEELLDQGLQRHGGETPPRARAPPGEGAACGASGATQAVFIRRARSRRFTPTELPGEP